MNMSASRQGNVDSCARSHLDKSKLKNTLDTDAPEVLLEFYRLYMVQLHELIGLIGQVSLPEEVGSVALLAHKMKSSSEGIGAFLVAARLSEVEQLAVAGDSESLRACLAHLVQDCDKTLLELKLEVLSLRIAIMA